jgi:hypothetical protein
MFVEAGPFDVCGDQTSVPYIVDKLGFLTTHPFQFEIIGKSAGQILESKMPLYDNAERLIRGNFAVVKRGGKPAAVAIGYLTADQMDQINTLRRHRNFPEIIEEVVFVGKHMFESRVIQNGYTVDEVLIQIESAMCTRSRLIASPKMTVMENPGPRLDGDGSWVRDQAILECTARHPHPDLYSVIPKGDRRTQNNKGRPEATLVAKN